MPPPKHPCKSPGLRGTHRWWAGTISARSPLLGPRGHRRPAGSHPSSCSHRMSHRSIQTALPGGPSRGKEQTKARKIGHLGQSQFRVSILNHVSNRAEVLTFNLIHCYCCHRYSLPFVEGVLYTLPGALFILASPSSKAGIIASILQVGKLRLTLVYPNSHG